MGVIPRHNRHRSLCRNQNCKLGLTICVIMNALPRSFRFWEDLKSNLLLKDGPKPTVSHYIGKSECIFFFS